MKEVILWKMSNTSGDLQFEALETIGEKFDRMKDQLKEGYDIAEKFPVLVDQIDIDL